MFNFSSIKEMLVKKSFHSLSMKLIVAIGGLILVGSLTFWYSIIYSTKEEMLKATTNHTKTYLNLIKKSIYTAMLTNNVAAIRGTFEGMTDEEGFVNLDIFNCRGRIIFSSDKVRRGKTIPPNSLTCTICHEKPDMPKESLKFDRNSLNEPQWTIIQEADTRVIKSVVPIFNEPSCYTSSCHYHSKSQQVLGILESDYSLKKFDAKIGQQNIATATFGVIFTALTSVILCIILWKIIIKPLLTLAEGMENVSKGNLDQRVEIHTRDELGMVSRTFNSMTRELKTARERLENWAKELEEEVAKKTEEIKRGQEQYIHTEKLASLGRMAAGVAHELNSPLTGIVTFAHLMMKRIPSDNKMDREDLEVIIEQAERCSKIIKGLLGFSRAIPAEKGEINIIETLKHTIAMIENQAKFHNINLELITDESLPPLKGDSSQIEQVFLNLLINASDSMNDKGKIFLKASKTEIEEKPYVEIEVTDTGPGIPEENLPRLFEPFFTTKPVGKGTGLGLAVSHGIVRKHGGHIMVESKPGQGTSFFVRLPIQQDQYPVRQ